MNSSSSSASVMATDEVTNFTVIAFLLHVGFMAIYCYTTFSSSATHGPTRFWRSQRIRTKNLRNATTGAESTASPSGAGGGAAFRPRFVDAPALNRRWAFVVLRSSQIHAIQTIRGTITGSIFFGQTAVMIVFLCLFFKSYTPRQHFIFMTIGVLAMASTVFLVQNLRMAYHLNYLVMVLPRKQKQSRADEVSAERKISLLPQQQLRRVSAARDEGVLQEPRSPRLPASPSRSSATQSPPRGDSVGKIALGDERGSPPKIRSSTPPQDGMTRRRASSMMTANVLDNSSLPRPARTLRSFLEETTAITRGLPRVPSHLMQSITHTTNVGEAALKHMMGKDAEAGIIGGNESSLVSHFKAEEDLDFQQHEERLADVLKLMSGNFALGVRSMIFALPLVLGLFHDAALLITSVLVMAVLAYFDRLM